MPARNGTEMVTNVSGEHLQKYRIENSQFCHGEVLLETEWSAVRGAKMTTAIDIVSSLFRWTQGAA